MNVKNYCSNCQSVHEAEESFCPQCQSRLQALKADDPVLLCKANTTIAMMLEPLLKEAQIPYSKISKLGAAMVIRAGNLLEEYTFYIPASKLEEASKLPPVWEQ